MVTLIRSSQKYASNIYFMAFWKSVEFQIAFIYKNGHEVEDYPILYGRETGLFPLVLVLDYI